MQEFLTVFLALAAVIGLLFLTANITKRFMKLTGLKTGGGIKVISCVSLGQDRTVAAVTAGKKKLLLGVTASGINVLCELSDEDISVMSDSNGDSQKTFGEIFSQNLKEKFGTYSEKDGKKK